VAQLNHTIVWCRDKNVSASFLVDLLGVAPPQHFGPFLIVELANEVSLDYHDTSEAISPQHYAFLVTDEEFDQGFARLEAAGQQYWADPGLRRPGQINRRDGGRGVYFEDPDGHVLEFITRPYGSGTG
jgi:catechol 2,3-dioxygenase-like lactoylglutathione lyase family enzyme